MNDAKTSKTPGPKRNPAIAWCWVLGNIALIICGVGYRQHQINERNREAAEEAQWAAEMHKIDESYGGKMPEMVRTQHEIEHQNRKDEEAKR